MSSDDSWATFNAAFLAFEKAREVHKAANIAYVQAHEAREAALLALGKANDVRWESASALAKANGDYDRARDALDDTPPSSPYSYSHVQRVRMAEYDRLRGLVQSRPKSNR